MSHILYVAQEENSSTVTVKIEADQSSQEASGDLPSEVFQNVATSIDIVSMVTGQSDCIFF